MLINVDSDPEGTITIGSAGAVFIDATTVYTEEETPAGMVGVQVTVSGLQGGHSGLDIDLDRGNAIKLLARLLWTLRESFPLRVASMAGGDRHNVIPRQAEAVVAVPAADVAALTEAVQTFAATVRDELRAIEPDLQIAAATTATSAAVMPSETQQRIVGALCGSPNQEAYQELFDHEADVLAVHAGLETSTIGANYPELDLISIGPTITGQHSIDERLEIASVGKVYDLLVAVLGRIP